MPVINMVSTSGGSNSSSSIIIKKPPTKRKYYEGERLNLQGMEVWLYQTGKSPVKIDTFTTIPAANTELTRYDSSILIQYQTSEIEYLHTNLNISILYPVALQEMIPPGVDRGVGKYKLNTSEAKYVMEYNDGSIKEIPNENLTTSPSNTDYTEGTIAADKYLNYTIIADDIKFMNRMYTVPQNVVNNIKICTFASGTWEEIGKLMRQNDAGELTLTNYWKVGDERKERINEKMYTLVVLDLNKTSTGGTKYNAAIGFKELLDIPEMKNYGVVTSISNTINPYYLSYSQNNNNYTYANFINNFSLDNPDINSSVALFSYTYGSRINGGKYNIISGTSPIIQDTFTANMLSAEIKNIIIKIKNNIKCNKIDVYTLGPTSIQNLSENITTFGIDGKTGISPNGYNMDGYSIDLYYLKNNINISHINIENEAYFHVYSSQDIIGDTALEYYKVASNRIKKLNDVPTKYYLCNAIILPKIDNKLYELPYNTTYYNPGPEPGRSYVSHTRRSRYISITAKYIYNNNAYITEIGDVISSYAGDLESMIQSTASTNKGITSSYFCI